MRGERTEKTKATLAHGEGSENGSRGQDQWYQYCRHCAETWDMENAPRAAGIHCRDSILCFNALSKQD